MIETLIYVMRGVLLWVVIRFLQFLERTIKERKSLLTVPACCLAASAVIALLMIAVDVFCNQPKASIALAFLYLVVSSIHFASSKEPPTRPDIINFVVVPLAVIALAILGAGVEINASVR